MTATEVPLALMIYGSVLENIVFLRQRYPRNRPTRNALCDIFPDYESHFPSVISTPRAEASHGEWGPVIGGRQARWKHPYPYCRPSIHGGVEYCRCVSCTLPLRFAWPQQEGVGKEIGCLCTHGERTQRTFVTKDLGGEGTSSRWIKGIVVVIRRVFGGVTWGFSIPLFPSSQIPKFLYDARAEFWAQSSRWIDTALYHRQTTLLAERVKCLWPSCSMILALDAAVQFPHPPIATPLLFPFATQSLDCATTIRIEKQK
jgi:hypothetical protein